MKNEKDERLNIRINSHDKRRLKKIIDNLNKNKDPSENEVTYSFIVEKFLNDYSKNIITGLDLDIFYLEKYIDDIDKKINELSSIKEMKEKELTFKRELYFKQLNLNQKEIQKEQLKLAIEDYTKRIQLVNNNSEFDEDKLIEKVANKYDIEVDLLKKAISDKTK